ncbi:MAG TPA: hypothetical protein VG498_15835 [Terriglobales bacterium]|nr:hypothetical protein [Terriglobales bacterium]
MQRSVSKTLVLLHASARTELSAEIREEGGARAREMEPDANRRQRITLVVRPLDIFIAIRRWRHMALTGSVSLIAD